MKAIFVILIMLAAFLMGLGQLIYVHKRRKYSFEAAMVIISGSSLVYFGSAGVLIIYILKYL